MNKDQLHYAIFSFFGTGLILGGVMGLAMAFFINPHQEGQITAVTPPSKTTTDVVMFCQELSSKATNKDWGYKSCLEEVSKTIKKKPVETL